jgi:hypothetical protein
MTTKKRAPICGAKRKKITTAPAENKGRDYQNYPCKYGPSYQNIQLYSGNFVSLYGLPSYHEEAYLNSEESFLFIFKDIMIGPIEIFKGDSYPK